jgi:hypothetical protein
MSLEPNDPNERLLRGRIPLFTDGNADAARALSRTKLECPVAGQLRPGIDGGMAHADRYPAVREAQKMVCRSSVKAASGAS